MSLVEVLRALPIEFFRNLALAVSKDSAGVFLERNAISVDISKLTDLLMGHSKIHKYVWKCQNSLSSEDFKSLVKDYDSNLSELKDIYRQAIDEEDQEILKRLWAGDLLCRIANAPLISDYQYVEQDPNEKYSLELKDKTILVYISITANDFLTELYPLWCKVHKKLFESAGIDPQEIGVILSVQDSDIDLAKEKLRSLNVELETCVIGVSQDLTRNSTDHGVICMYRFYAMIRSFEKSCASLAVISDVDVVLDVENIVDALNAKFDWLPNYFGGDSSKESTLNFKHLSGGASVYKNTERLPQLLSHLKVAFDESQKQAVNSKAIDQTALDYAALTLPQNVQILNSDRTARSGHWSNLNSYGRPRLMLGAKSGPLNIRSQFLQEFLK